jgi:plastocyanin
MNKKVLVIIGLIVVLGAVILIWRNSLQQNQLQEKVSQAENAGSEVKEGEVTLDIKGFAFNPEIIKVKKGTKITWVNRDDAPHTVTSDEGDFLDSPVFSKDGSFEKIFDTVGTFRYHCTPHPNMLGAVIVVD